MVTQAVTNLTNVFPTNTIPTEVTIAKNVGCSGETIVFHISCCGRGLLSGLHTLIKNGQGTTRATTTASFYFNQSQIHQAWSRSQRFTGISAANMLFTVQQSSTALIVDGNDFITIVMGKFPF
jgi:hypothetical protein